MDDADKILIHILSTTGLEISDESITLEDFSPDLLINATGLCLEIIFESKGESCSFPKSCPPNIAARYKVGQTLATALQKLGYKQTIGYQSFLYPNVKDTRNILSFLIEILPKDSGPDINDTSDVKTTLNSTIQNVFSESIINPWLPYFCYNNYRTSSISTKHVLLNFETQQLANQKSKWSLPFPSLSNQFDNLPDMISSLYNYNKMKKLTKQINFDKVIEKMNVIIRETNENESVKVNQSASIPKFPQPRRRSKYLIKTDQKDGQEKNQEELELENLEKILNELKVDYENSVTSYNKLIDDITYLKSNTEKLTKEQNNLETDIKTMEKDSAVKEKIGIVLNNGEETYDKLKSAIGKKSQNIELIEQKWENHKNEMEQKIEEQKQRNNLKHSKQNLLEQQLIIVQEAMDDCRKDYQDKGNSMNIYSEKVKQILSNNTTYQTRKDFTKRIFELTENKKKQDLEIKRILNDIFLLQKDINSLRGKLERSFIETNDCIYYEAKKDVISKKMYKVLIGIHDNCQNLIEVIEEKGRLLREIRDIETNMELENRESVEKNLSQITNDFEQAKEKCNQLKTLMNIKK